MDDIIIFSNSKEQLWDWFKKIKIYLKEELDLDIKSNYQVFPTNVRGVDFVGYRHFIGYKLLRKSTLKTCKETAKKMENRHQGHRQAAPAGAAERPGGKSLRHHQLRCTGSDGYLSQRQFLRQAAGTGGGHRKGN